MSKLNVKTGDCALCSNKEVDTIQADCHVLYRGEWINQISPVCFDCAAKRVSKNELVLKEVTGNKPITIHEPKKEVKANAAVKYEPQIGEWRTDPVKEVEIKKAVEDVTQPEPKLAIKHPKVKAVSKPKKAY